MALGNASTAALLMRGRLGCRSHHAQADRARPRRRARAALPANLWLAHGALPGAGRAHLKPAIAPPPPPTSPLPLPSLGSWRLEVGDCRYAPNGDFSWTQLRTEGRLGSPHASRAAPQPPAARHLSGAVASGAISWVRRRQRLGDDLLLQDRTTFSSVPLRRRPIRGRSQTEVYEMDATFF